MPTFSELPTETKLNVFAFIRNNNDRARSCLVSRDWLTCMAPIIWETLEVKSNTATAENLAAILHLESNIIKNIRYINIKPSRQEKLFFELEAVAQIIISALPRNSLCGFTCLWPIRLPLLVQLLHGQRAMAGLDICINETTYDCPVQFNVASYAIWTAPALTNLKHLAIRIRADCPESYEAGGALISNAHQLKALTVWGGGDPVCIDHGSGQLNIFQGYSANSPDFKPLELLHLELFGIDLGPRSVLAQYVNVQNLRTLQISSCPNGLPVISSLASSLSNESSLVGLAITVLDDEEGMTQAVEKLIGSFYGLQILSLDMDKARMIDVSCLVRHGSTLRQLLLASVDTTQRSITMDAIQAVISSCSQLEGLALSFPNADMGHAQTLGSDFELFKTCNVDRAPTELEAFLVLSSLLRFRYYTDNYERTSLRATAVFASYGSLLYPPSIMESQRTPQLQTTLVSLIQKCI